MKNCRGGKLPASMEPWADNAQMAVGAESVSTARRTRRSRVDGCPRTYDSPGRAWRTMGIRANDAYATHSRVARRSNRVPGMALQVLRRAHRSREKLLTKKMVDGFASWLRRERGRFACLSRFVQCTCLNIAKALACGGSSKVVVGYPRIDFGFL